MPGLLPSDLPGNVREALRDVQVASDPGDPAIDPEWGEPGLTPTEQLFGWNTLEILAFTAGNPEAPVNAIPGSARTHCQICYAVGSDADRFLPHLRQHLESHVLTMCKWRKAASCSAPPAWTPTTRGCG